MSMATKIQTYHLQKVAYVYLRQSTMKQVMHNQESTERQYALTTRAEMLGWPRERIMVLDEDLGLSGTSSIKREDFKTLVSDVSMKKVGAVFALEVSRLARSNTDWHRLLELCAITHTLIIDEDGCYDPTDFNDQLLLGLKGTMSAAELHFLRGRLQGGKLNKAKKGTLCIPIPAGLTYKQQQIVLDPDDRVRGALRLLFSTFKRVGSAYGVVRYFKEQKFEFPKRVYGGAWAGTLKWQHLSYGRVLSVLRNPLYAGAYVYGRHQYTKVISIEGIIQSKKENLPLEQWKVHIQSHHEAYISWEEFLSNQEALTRNRTNNEMLSGPLRDGLALLQGLLLCSTCGRRLTVRYTGTNGIYPCYECHWRKKDGLSDKICLLARADVLDAAVSKRVLEKLRPQQLEIAIKSIDELEDRYRSVDKQWRMRIQRAEYDTQLAQKRYEEVDPSNRLVALTLESQWNDSLAKLENIKEEYSKYQQKKAVMITPEQRNKILALVQDFPRLWHSSTTKFKDKKRMLRLIIKDITVERIPEPKKVILHVRWQDETCEDISIDLPKKIYERIQYPKKLVDRVRQLAFRLSDEHIAIKFNRQGLISAKSRSFTAIMIGWIRRKYGIPSIQQPAGEFTVGQMMEKFGVSRHVVYYWIKRDIIRTRRIRKKSPYWIKIDSQKEEELSDWIKTSSKISKPGEEMA
jgi:DNA invertase Pin-like site-specific DNA recombinase